MANAMKKKTKYTLAFSATDAVMHLLLLFPISTLFQLYVPALNKVIFFFTYLTLLFTLFSKRNTVRLIALPILILIYIWATVHTDFPIYNENEYFYYQFLVLYTLLMTTKNSEVQRFFLSNAKYVHGIIYTWCALIAFCAVIPSFYPYHNLYFKPFNMSGFRSSPTALFIMSLIVIAMVYYKNRRLFALSFIPLYVIFTGNSRTYFLVGLLSFVVLFYIYCKGKTKFYVYAVPGSVLGYMAYSYTSVHEKIDASIDTSGAREDFWFKLTSGRSVFWDVDIEAYKNFDIGKLLFGNGFNYVYDVNNAARHGYIWAHNDFINLLLGFGAIGTIIYVTCIVALIVFVLYRGKCKIPTAIVFLIAMIWFANAMLNMFYTYFCACASFPLLLLAVNKYYTDKHEADLKKKAEEAEMHRMALEARRKRGLKT